MLKNYTTSSKKKRLKAFFWDISLPILPLFILFIIYWLFQIIGVVFGVEPGMSVQSVISTIGFLSFIWIPIYWIICLRLIHKTGQTIGKRKVGITIIDLKNNSKIGVSKYLFSRFGTIFIIFLLSLLSPVLLVLEVINVSMILFDKNNDAFHDKVWKTRVVEFKK